MRIIENPNPREEQIKVCPKCDCRFAYNSNDTHSWNNGIIGPGYSGDHWVNCPNCGEHISLIERREKYKKFDIPESLKTLIQSDDPLYTKM